MEKYVSHFSAAEMWNIPYIDAVFGPVREHRDPVNITVCKRNARFGGIGEKAHLCELALPMGAVVSRNSKMVASPELLFLELASSLSIHRLILLGLQMCSHPPGIPAEAITTKQKLNTFLRKVSGHRGHRKALRAVKYMGNGSASVMESIAYMILTLPHSLGGYGLNGAVFNHEIMLKKESRVRLGQNRCFLDLYYREARLAVEYESFTYHNSPLEQGKDVMRSAMLERQGIGVMHFSTIQLYDKEACKEFAYNLAARLGKRMQIRTTRFTEMHGTLRGLLPDGKLAPIPDRKS